MEYPVDPNRLDKIGRDDICHKIFNRLQRSLSQELGYKPKFIEFGGLDTLPADIVKILGLALKTAVYSCGNCNNLITFEFRSKRPIRCLKCGEDIDWLDEREREKIIYCPQCGRTDFDLKNDAFCDSCPTKVRLKISEIE